MEYKFVVYMKKKQDYIYKDIDHYFSYNLPTFKIA